MIDLKEAVKRAITHHQSGELQEAEKLYREILKFQPDNFYALHYLGVIHIQYGNYDSAIEFIEKALKEGPGDSHAHYNLGIYYVPPEASDIREGRGAFGLNPNSILSLCCQSLFKYLPQYDEIFPRIAQGVKDCQFIFISHASKTITERLRTRFDKAFNRFNLNSADYIVFLPRLDQENFNVVNCVADIFLDSIGWSGNNTTFEAIACNLPAVTFPGALMRGRHCGAILTMMGITETIASNLNEYIELSVRLGLDSQWRKRISEKIAANKHRIYRDDDCITALENFLEAAVKEKLLLNHD